MIGMAVGAGNLWRFPRIIAENGGAAFLIPYVLFLFTWAFPLLLLELGLGRYYRRGPAAAFACAKRALTPLGLFVAFCTMGVLFYYAVVTGWCLKYAVSAVTSSMLDNPAGYWTAFTKDSWQPTLFHLVAVALAFAIVRKGVGGIERANKVFVPTLFVLLILLTLRAATLPNSGEGFLFLFKPDFGLLLDANTWIQALAQIAWSTGAGMGLVAVYAIYMPAEYNSTETAVGTCTGDVAASLLAASAIVPTVFFALGPKEAYAALEAGNTGLTFIWIPRLFNHIPFGELFLFIFFFSLLLAALSSLIALMELSICTFQEFGLPRSRASLASALLVLGAGLPSSLSLSFLTNQDWVWSIGLIINGLFFAILARQTGLGTLREIIVNDPHHVSRIWAWFAASVRLLIPAQFALLLGWWIYQTVTTNPDSWWDPFEVTSVGTWVAQLSILFVICLFLKRRLLGGLYGKYGG